MLPTSLSSMKSLIFPPFSTLSLHFPKTKPFAFFSLPSKTPNVSYPKFLHVNPSMPSPRPPIFSIPIRQSHIETPQSSSLCGEVHVIVGPMFAGKTTTLLHRIQAESNNGRTVAVIKSNKDTRYGLDSIVTHDGMKLPCWALASLSSFRLKIGPDAYDQLDVIGIDEAQFFEDLYDFCCEAADHDGKTVIVAGLDGDPNPTFLSLQRLQLSFTFPLKIFIFPSKIIEEIKMRWEKVPLYQQEVGGFGEACSGPGKRWGHTCNSIKGGRFLYVFGGYGQDNCQTNRVHVFDAAKQTWSQPVMKGTPPSARDSHSCTTIGDNLFVFGGTDGVKPLKDLHILETCTNTWICPSVRGEGPEEREGHGAAVVGKRLFIFGGCGKSSDNNDEVYYNNLYILNTETFVWKLAAISGNPPSARDSHTCSSWKNKIIVIGGEDPHDYYLSDVHIFDADTLAWKELNTLGQILPPRAGHSSVAFGKNLFVFGGFSDAQNLYDDLYMLDVETGLWTKVITTGDGPSARFSVSGDCLDPLKSGVLIFIGGCNKTLEALDDMYYLYTGLVIKDERKLEKLSLRKQLKLKCQQENLSNLVRDKAFVSIEADNDLHHQPISLFSCGQASRDSFPSNEVLLQGKKIFHANVTESFPHGYTIETIIDGTQLRGILFSNKPNSVGVANYNLCRKRTSLESGDSVFGDCNSNSKSKSSRSMMQDYGDCKQGDVHEKDCSLHEAEAPAPSSRNPASYDLSICKDLAKQESSVAHLNLTDDNANDTPNSGSEVLKCIGSVGTDFSVALSPRKMSREQTPWSATNPKYHYKQ